jgi:hypothetical protein
MSIHAPFLLAAYARVANDPLVFLPLSVRRELEPGLFTLCEIASVHARNAVVADLGNVGEKATLKALWQEYEKQKYSGQG